MANLSTKMVTNAQIIFVATFTDTMMSRRYSILYFQFDLEVLFPH